MKIRLYTLALLVLAMGSFLLLHFGLILVYGRFYIYESNPVVLLGEITFMVVVVVFGGYCLIDQLRKNER